MLRGKVIFRDGLEYEASENWSYCTLSEEDAGGEKDRRFFSEHVRGIPPAGRSNLTNDGHVMQIPRGAYDVGDGFYDASEKSVFAYDTVTVLRKPTDDEINWIIANCRREDI